ncbi:unnamed protein product [Prorocentrum cordatum]|uniref:Uncharacterized protein n=1 Tax=Prorocentrum cordatum TaxID=2364126 RepID=A0ABN9PCC9_9DINO|nr:unnamed protein product [Polarella glacialis]
MARARPPRRWRPPPAGGPCREQMGAALCFGPVSLLDPFGVCAACSREGAEERRGARKGEGARGTGGGRVTGSQPSTRGADARRARGGRRGLPAGAAAAWSPRRLARRPPYARWRVSSTSTTWTATAFWGSRSWCS